ncbi:MAG TPA: response regulator [Anaerolineales bacterium]|nr:response regulator [Anaerolineales bacterium]
MSTIWIVDDDVEMTGAMQLMMQVLFQDSRTFSGAREAAQALLAGGTPDLILLDINMPEVSGLDFLEFVRRRSEWQHLPIVMLSTEAADVTVDQALALGADGYITKPVTLEELERALISALEKRKKGAL